MLILFLLELDVENALADGQPAELLDFLDVQLAGLLGDHLQAVKGGVGYVGILVFFEVFVVEFVQMLEFVF
jgi:hypothetical protein